jgi:hypothetical protein
MPKEEDQPPPRAVAPHKGSPLQEDSHLDKVPLQGLSPLALLKAVILKGSLQDVTPNLSNIACQVPLVALHQVCSLAVRHRSSSHTHSRYPLLNNSSQCRDVSDTLVYVDSSSETVYFTPFTLSLSFFLVLDAFIGVSLTLDYSLFRL